MQPIGRGGRGSGLEQPTPGPDLAQAPVPSAYPCPPLFLATSPVSQPNIAARHAKDDVDRGETLCIVCNRGREQRGNPREPLPSISRREPCEPAIWSTAIPSMAVDSGAFSLAPGFHSELFLDMPTAPSTHPGRTPWSRPVPGLGLPPSFFVWLSPCRVTCKGPERKEWTEEWVGCHMPVLRAAVPEYLYINGGQPIFHVSLLPIIIPCCVRDLFSFFLQ